MINVILTKIRSNHSNLRTDVIEGETPALPNIGDDFILFSKSLDPKGAIRMVQTTNVKFVEQIGNTYQFNTENSVYKLEVLDETS